MLQALSAAIIAFAGLYIRSFYTIRPDAVYRKALVQLNTSPAILEVGPQDNRQLDQAKDMTACIACCRPTALWCLALCICRSLLQQ